MLIGIKRPAILPHDLSVSDPRLCADLVLKAGLPFRKDPLAELATQSELLDQRLVATFVLALQIVEKAAALRDELEKTTTGMVVLLVVLEVLGQVLDAL